MNNGLIPRRLTQPKTMLVIVIIVVFLGLMSLSGNQNSEGAVKPGTFAPGADLKRDSGFTGGASPNKAPAKDKDGKPVKEEKSSSSSSSSGGGAAPKEDGNIDYCEILREPVLLNQRSHWDNFAENPKGALPVPDHSEGEIGNWFGTLAYFSSIEAGDLENPHRFFTSCEMACNQNEECVSFLYERYLTEIDNHKYIDKHHDRCYLNKHFQYGTERLPQVDTKEKPGAGEVWNGRSWTAGWHRERALKWLMEEKGCTRPTRRPSRREQREQEEAAAQRAEEEAAAARFAAKKVDDEAPAEYAAEYAAAVPAAVEAAPAAAAVEDAFDTAPASTPISQEDFYTGGEAGY